MEVILQAILHKVYYFYFSWTYWAYWQQIVAYQSFKNSHATNFVHKT